MNQGLDAPDLRRSANREAEFTKFVDNSFHALKVAYANESRTDVRQRSGSTPKWCTRSSFRTPNSISRPYYLRPGGPFGGSCLPKDVRALQYIASDVGANTHVIDALIRSNEAHKHFLFEKRGSRNLKLRARRS